MCPLSLLTRVQRNARLSRQLVTFFWLSDSTLPYKPPTVDVRRTVLMGLSKILSERRYSQGGHSVNPGQLKQAHQWIPNPTKSCSRNEFLNGSELIDSVLSPRGTTRFTRKKKKYFQLAEIICAEGLKTFIWWWWLDNLSSVLNVSKPAAMPQYSPLEMLAHFI